jgi:hypothetical protein
MTTGCSGVFRLQGGFKARPYKQLGGLRRKSARADLRLIEPADQLGRQRARITCLDCAAPHAVIAGDGL